MIIIETNPATVGELTMSDKFRRRILIFAKKLTDLDSLPEELTEDDELLIQQYINAAKVEYESRAQDYLISFPDASIEELEDQVGGPLDSLESEMDGYFENAPRYLFTQYA